MRVVSLCAATAVLLASVDAAQQNEVAWPSLRLDFTLTRSSTKVHGQSAFSVVANPNVSPDSTSVLYDTFAAFKKDSTSYNYSLVEGIAYLSEDNAGDHSSARCLDSDALPSINGLVAALNEATAISNTSTECFGSLLKTSVDGVDFVVCYSGLSGFTMEGSEMDISVKFLESRVEIEPPTVKMNSPTKCVAVASSTWLTPLGKELLTGKPINSVAGRKLEGARGLSDIFHPDEKPCKCLSTPRPCVFIHGLKIGEEESGLRASPSAYWGNLTGHAPCCTSMKYAVLNTLNNSWTNDTQQQKVCDRALSVSKTSQDTTISDTIVVTHSMGALILAGAIATEKCSLDNSTTWIAMAAPMKGSMASDYFQESCDDKTNIISEEFVESTGYCPAPDGIKSVAYEGGSYASAELNKAYKAAQKVYYKQVYALMCSNGYSGLTSKWQPMYWGMGATFPHKSRENDGVVEFSSCASDFPKAKFGHSYRDRFYVTKLNHGDTAFRNGDGTLSKAKMPIKWFSCLL